MKSNGFARWFNVGIGMWLYISAFVWIHTYAQFTNAWLIGLACAVTAGVAMHLPRFRYVNAALAVWLFISVWALPTEAVGTFWNHLLTAAAMFIVALVPDVPSHTHGDDDGDAAHAAHRAIEGGVT